MPKYPVILAAVTVGVSLLLTGCSAPAKSPATPKAAPTPSATPKAVTASAISMYLQAKVPQVTKVIQITEDNDPNNLIGRPNEYSQAATLYDSRTPCTDLGADCGATIEIWPTAAMATARGKYIQKELKAYPILGPEYDLVHGTALLRVTGVMKPTDEAGYATAWAAYFTS